MDEVKLLPCEEAVARERERIMEIHRSAVMETFKLMLGAGMPGGKPHERQKTRWIIKGFEMATDAIRRAIDESAEATRPPIVTDEVVERVKLEFYRDYPLSVGYGLSENGRDYAVRDEHFRAAADEFADRLIAAMPANMIAPTT